MRQTLKLAKFSDCWGAHLSIRVLRGVLDVRSVLRHEVQLRHQATERTRVRRAKLPPVVSTTLFPKPLRQAKRALDRLNVPATCFMAYTVRTLLGDLVQGPHGLSV